MKRTNFSGIVLAGMFFGALGGMHAFAAPPITCTYELTDCLISPKGSVATVPTFGELVGPYDNVIDEYTWTNYVGKSYSGIIRYRWPGNASEPELYLFLEPLYDSSSMYVTSYNTPQPYVKAYVTDFSLYAPDGLNIKSASFLLYNTAYKGLDPLQTAVSENAEKAQEAANSDYDVQIKRETRGDEEWWTFSQPKAQPSMKFYIPDFFDTGVVNGDPFLFRMCKLEVTYIDDASGVDVIDGAGEEAASALYTIDGRKADSMSAPGLYIKTYPSGKSEKILKK